MTYRPPPMSPPTTPPPPTLDPADQIALELARDIDAAPDAREPRTPAWAVAAAELSARDTASEKDRAALHAELAALTARVAQLESGAASSGTALVADLTRLFEQARETGARQAETAARIEATEKKTEAHDKRLTIRSSVAYALFMLGGAAGQFIFQLWTR
jgi:hypothetical protein